MNARLVRRILEDELELTRNLLYTTLMASTFKGSLEEGVENLLSLVVRNETTWEHENVSIVVLTNELRNLRTPSDASTHCLMLVQRHGDSLSRATDADTNIHLS